MSSLSEIARRATEMGMSYGEFVSKGLTVPERPKPKRTEKPSYTEGRSHGYKLGRKVRRVDKEGNETIFDNPRQASEIENVGICTIYHRILAPGFVSGYKWSYVEDEE